MKKFGIIMAIVVLLVLIFFATGPFYIVNEGEAAVITRFGQIVGVETGAGLKLKSPFTDSVVTFTKKIMPWDGESRQIQTSQNELVWVSAVARWHIVDFETFYKTVSTMESAYNLLSNEIDSAVRTVVAKNKIVEVVRSSNKIQEISVSEVFQTGDPKDDEVLASLDIGSTSYERVEKGRQKLAADMLAQVTGMTLQYGIEVIDVVILDVAYTEDKVAKIYERMITERASIAKAYRSLGEGKKQTILGEIEKAQKTIEADANKLAAEIKGKADAEAARIYAKAYSVDPEFYAFWRAIESYKKTIPSFSKTISTDMDYFKYLYSPSGR
jgi:membrane protease subunit HflC